MFPLRFPPPPPPPPRLLAAVAAAGGIALRHHSKSPNHPSLSDTLNSLLFAAPSSLMASLSLSDLPPGFVDSRTGSEFPGVIDGGKRRLMGVGVRRKKVFGLKNIDVYAFGIYVDESDVKKYLKEKHRKLAIDVLESTKNFHEGLMESDVSLTIRLQIVYGRLSIGSIRSAFEESVGSRLQKFGGADTNELLQRFTAQFKDEYKIPKGSVIELSRENGHTLRTTIDGKEVGSIESKVLCRSVLDLYIGEQPFDERAKKDVRSKLASILESQFTQSVRTWARTVMENLGSLIGRTAPLEFLAKLTYLIWNHRVEIKNIDTVRACTFGLNYFVERDIVLPENMLLIQAHNIGDKLHEKIEQLPDVERALVHIDFEFTHGPEHTKL